MSRRERRELFVKIAIGAIILAFLLTCLAMLLAPEQFPNLRGKLGLP